MNRLTLLSTLSMLAVVSAFGQTEVHGGITVPHTGSAQFSEWRDTANTYRQVIESTGSPAGNGCIDIDLSGAGAGKALVGTSTSGVGASGLTCRKVVPTYVGEVKACAAPNTSTNSTTADNTIATINLTGLSSGGQLVVEALWSKDGGGTVAGRNSITFGSTTTTDGPSAWEDATQDISRTIVQYIHLTGASTQYVGGYTLRYATTPTQWIGGNGYRATMSEAISGTVALKLNGWMTSATAETITLRQYCVTYKPPTP